MIATLGDLVDDVVVRVDDPVNIASDTTAVITRRGGGSAANVARTVAALGCPARFVGQVGDDALGAALVTELSADGVDVSLVRRAGRTGSIVVLVDPSGERTMLTDRGASAELDRPDPAWLDGVAALHVPMYSLWGGATGATAGVVIGWAADRGIAVSIDVSSVSLIHAIGVDAVRSTLERLAPAVVFANADEAAALALDGPIGRALTVVKAGAEPTICHRPGGSPLVVEVAPVADVVDTTGAGDAFAAGFLTGEWRSDLSGAVERAHGAARVRLASR